MRVRRSSLTALLFVLSPAVAPAQTQVTAADYDRAATVSTRLEPLIVGMPSMPEWIGDSHRFWYTRTVEGGGHEWIVVDAETSQKGRLFDHARMAEALSAATGETYAPNTLPFAERGPRPSVADAGDAITFRVEGAGWRCAFSTYTCMPSPPASDVDGRPDEPESVFSPDHAWEATVRNFNVAVRATADGDDAPFTILSLDGSEGDAYELRSLRWSPDSRHLAAYRVKPGYQRYVHYVESSPDDQIQPKHSMRYYQKPGDVRDKQRPVLFDVETKTQTIVDDALFPNAYQLRNLKWWDDGRGFTFEYNERGHMNYRVVEVDAHTGAARALIDEQPETFFNYDGTLWRYDVDDGREMLWRSERDGWKHLWLYDGVTGRVKNQVTKGHWVVRDVDSVDVAHRQVWFEASGMDPREDPYLIHYYRIGFDGTGLTSFTPGNGTHQASWSRDRAFYVDRWSRVDEPTVLELRRTSDQRRVAELERADVSALEATGWQRPEVFTAKGRDGVTDIWGIIVRPTNFDPSKRYPVIENIYAGPQGSFTPKSFGLQAGMQSLAELGFIVVQMDGMGTNNRSKAFHDVAWHDLGDAGFPDRIAWHRAVAQRYAWYDTTRVGIYGTSAGGQNSLGALLFHPDFYDAAVSAAGCHDNRMDKIWWNELWMSWPIGPQYSASSNVDNAYRLQGDLLLIVGEMDTNVDPSSTMQVVDRLIDADKDFDLLVIPGAGHTSGGVYGTRKRNDFFVHHLLGVEPPAWNRVERAADDGSGIDDDFDAWLEVPTSELYPSTSGWR